MLSCQLILDLALPATYNRPIFKPPNQTMTTPAADQTTSPAPTAAAPLSHEEVLSICRRIDDAKAGRGEMPTREEIKAAYDSIRVRRVAAPSKKSREKAASTPIDLDSLFTE